MGLLDDAIREHLELKRRRGADSGEITRQEQEAFGAARRGDTEPALDAPGEFAAEAAPTALHVVEDHHHEESEPPRPHGDPANDLPHAEPAPAPVPARVEEPEHDHELAEPPRP